MADDVTQTAQTTDATGPTKNPLDVLEELLGEIDGKGSAKSKTPQNQTKAPTGPTPEEIAAQELEEKKRIYEEKKQQQAIIDAQMIAQQKRALEENMQNSQENKTRHLQDEEKKTEQAQQQDASQGYEIDQLDHTKI